MRNKNPEKGFVIYRGCSASQFHLAKKAMPHHDLFQEEVAKQAAEKFDGKSVVVELGVGTGETTQALMRICNMRKIGALYLVEREIDLLRQIPAEQYKKHCNATVMHFRNFIDSLDSLNPDVVYSALTIHNMRHEDQIALFRKIHEKLAKGGRFVDGDVVSHEDPRKQEAVFEAQMDRFREHLPAKLAQQWIAHYRKDRDEIGHVTVSELRRKLSETGFSTRVTFREGLEAVLVADKV
ncbi:class I SAM-dependent methyltransferase [Candidatus Micrarchaeota archaeon]|nr:class I SAM-dependent methyltransferase [Candidatus Micrarchaeota archaeon]